MNIWAVLLLSSALAACGGGGGGGGKGGSSGASSSASSEINLPGTPLTQQTAARLLVQASFGPTQATIDGMTGNTAETWIAREFEKPQASALEYVDQFAPTTPTQNMFWESFWKGAISGQDQLRQRMAYALSQIFVISFDGDGITVRGVASYYDMLGRNAFGNFRTLLQDVSLHPMMGTYLTHIRNQKENVATGRVPDENYAREVMQLFTIGLYQLNLDGTPKLAGGNPVESYTNTDVSGLAKVFTGWSWGGPDITDTRFYGGGTQDPNRDVIPMQAYPKFHSVSTKAFLGTTIAAQGTANPAASLSAALDTLFNHPNVGPFIGKQLIQRLVTSNPSPAYVARVASAFNNNGAGVRGDMKAVIRAILLDSEARDLTTAQGNNFGKLREPVIRLANWGRAFNAAPSSSRYAIGDTTNSGSSLGQAIFKSPSVFNFYRPGYVPPNTGAATAGLVVPEMQITHETSVAGYINYMQGVIPSGPSSSSGVTADRVIANYASEIALTDSPTQLVDRVNLLLLANGMKAATRTQIINAVSAIALTGNAAAIDTARKNRVYLAIYLAMASPDYLVQK
ncbi:DUF1800 domain-containing protein [Uliginosibacterium sp. H3]|uniref:DUF1800 domain-containing protein n=1 Tax=Uliginosibacterium silvisoli TaxID=3114758 RepID=A0ABU6K1A7_9RHOO|nr:DUF1800 domain-containing protein [Uliginosibacterium sp. H3]